MKLITYLIIGHIVASWLCRRDWINPLPAQTEVGMQASVRSLFYTTVLTAVLAIAMPAIANNVTLGIVAMTIFVGHRRSTYLILPIETYAERLFLPLRKALKMAFQKGQRV